MMQEVITANLDRISELCRAHHVLRLAVFGSAVRDDFDAGRSDVDLVVEFEPVPVERYADNYFGLESALTSLFSRQVDLIVAGSVRNPFIRSAIEAQQKTLYGA